MPISISVVMASAIAISATIAAIVAFIPTYQNGITSTQETVDSLRENIIGRVDNGVANFFKGPAQTGKTISAMTTNGMEFATGSIEQITGRMCALVHDNTGVLTSTMYLNDTFYMCDNRFNTWLGGIYNASQGRLYVYLYDIETSTFLRDASNNLIPFMAFEFLELDNKHMLEELSVFNHTMQRWQPAHDGFDSIQYSAMSFPNGPNGAPAAMTLDILPQSIEMLLMSIGLKKRARAVAVDGQRQLVIGTSFGAKIAVLKDWMNFNADEADRMQFFKMNELEDPLINEMYDHLGGADKIFAIDGKFNTTMGSGKDKVFIDITQFQDDGGMDVRILIAMPELDFLEDTYSTRDKTIGGVVGALAGLIILAVIFSILLARPLARLGTRMYKTASLQDDDEDDPPSFMTEVLDMQEAYTTMKQELNRMKSYLPQSVLYGAGDDAPEDDDEGELASQSELSNSQSENHSELNNSSTLGHLHKSSGSWGASGERASVSSRSSHVSRKIESSTRGAVPVGALNTNKSVLTKRVVVVVFNLCGFLKKLDSTTAARVLPQLQDAFLTVVNWHVRENRGVVDMFQGDHIVATFNAVSHVACAPKRATAAALAACAEIAKNPELPAVSVGMSAGMAHVGNMGNNDMRRFNIVGPAYVEAMMMERLAREQLATNPHRCPWRVLTLSNMVRDISLEMYYQCVDLVLTPSHPKEPQVVIAVDRLKTVTQGEWMYQLEEGAKTDPFVQINDTFALILEGNTVDAKAVMDTVPLDHAASLLGYSRAKHFIAHECQDLEQHATNVTFVVPPNGGCEN